ncbi:MAG: hypothetical protein IIA45_04105 [Bacteroidetes bacterium]|nr:hypothetical protein [Bacteroidota bacterium]
MKWQLIMLYVVGILIVTSVVLLVRYILMTYVFNEEDKKENGQSKITKDQDVFSQKADPDDQDSLN